MYNQLKNTAIGFAISFIGSIPLGYLNIIGLEFYKAERIDLLIKYLLGVVIIEVFVIYITFKLASKLTQNQRWKKTISLFTIIFLATLALLFYNGNNASQIYENPFQQFIQYPFFVGIVLSSINFAQIPFWFSWNIYLINESYIQDRKDLKNYYITGASVGTFLGMLTLIIGLHKAISYTQTSFSFQKYIWVLFVGLALFQLYIYLKKLKFN